MWLRQRTNSEQEKNFVSLPSLLAMVKSQLLITFGFTFIDQKTEKLNTVSLQTVSCLGEYIINTADFSFSKFTLRAVCMIHVTDLLHNYIIMHG